MSRSEPLVLPRIAILLAAVAASGSLAVAAARADDLPRFPAGFTGDLSHVPDLPPSTLTPPYPEAWQRELLAFEVRYLADLGTPTAVDTIETGAIKAAD